MNDIQTSPSPIPALPLRVNVTHQQRGRAHYQFDVRTDDRAVEFYLEGVFVHRASSMDVLAHPLFFDILNDVLGAEMNRRQQSDEYPDTYDPQHPEEFAPRDEGSA